MIPAARRAARAGAQVRRPRSGGASATGSSTRTTIGGGVLDYEPVGRVGLQPRRERLHARRCSTRSRRSSASRSTSTPGRSSSSSGTRRPSHEFVHLLNYTDEQQKLTGDPGADFRQEAYTYIAGSLDNFDFTGPGAGRAVHRAAGRPRDGQEPGRGRGEAPRRDRPRAGPAARSPRTSPGPSRSTRRWRSSSGRSTSTRTRSPSTR